MPALGGPYVGRFTTRTSPGALPHARAAERGGHLRAAEARISRLAVPARAQNDTTVATIVSTDEVVPQEPAHHVALRSPPPLEQEQTAPSGQQAAQGAPGTSDTQQPSNLQTPVFLIPRLPTQQPPETDRPLLPPVDLENIIQTIFMSEPPMPEFLCGLNAMAGEAPTSPVLYRPQVPRPAGSPDPATLPLLLYLPGIDGTGLAAYRQFEGLSMQFDLCALFIPPADRSSFEQVVQAAQTQLEAELAGGDLLRPVYLLGESFGGLVALALAQHCQAVDRVVLCNPATSFTDSIWPMAGPLLTSLPTPLYNSLPVLLSPMLTNPINVALHALPRRPAGSLPPSPVELASAAAWGLVGLLPELGSLKAVLPPPTLAHRLALLREGSRAINATISQVQQRVLLLVGENDLVIPSATEGPRLKKALPRCNLRVLQGRSHAMLQEAGLDLPAILSQEGFYVRRRRLSSPPEGLLPGGNRKRRLTASFSKGNSVPALAPPGLVPTSGAKFGHALPLELPTPIEVKKAMDEGGLVMLKALVSPVFFSTDPQTGELAPGLGHVPLGRPGKPVLLVGNHQLFAPDMPLMIAQFLQERGTLVRGLAHPFALGGFQADERQAQQTPPVERATSPFLGASLFGAQQQRRRQRDGEDEPGSLAFAALLKTFGGVPVSAYNLHALMSLGETALLYPGGVREAHKLKGEQYQLIWPNKPEFVRLAARFGATIVPFGAVGAEDSVNIVLDSQELLRTPLLSDWLRSQPQFANAPQARRGVTASANNVDNFVPPLITFNAPARFYYVFGRPIDTSLDLGLAEDRVGCEQLYADVKASCEESIAYLLRRRQEDPYGDLVRRIMWEGAWSGTKQAPTFTIP